MKTCTKYETSYSSSSWDGKMTDVNESYWTGM